MTTSIPFIEETREHVELINACARIFDRPELCEADIALYFSLSDANNAQEICRAIRYWIKNGRNFPAPVNIRELVHVIHGREQEKTLNNK